MSNSKTTKSALLTSAMSMLLCVAMLIGSTFAWFTDSATSAGNKIVAGKLDVKLYMHNGTDYVNIGDEKKPIFGTGSLAQDNNAETLWEPGKTQVAYLKIANEGNLDLKYTVALKVENVSKKLYEVMEYAIVPDADVNNKVASWTSGNSVVEGTQSVSNETELKKDEIHYFALAIHMDEEAGNDYQNGEVNFDLTVLATQLNSEEDSFGKDYDKLATYDTNMTLARTKSFTATDVLELTKNDGTKVTILGTDLSISTKESPHFGAHLGENVSLDTAYQFQQNMSVEDVANSEYADWHADFVVYADKDVPADSIALAGYYTAWCQYNDYKWVALPNIDMPVPANEEIRLVGSMNGITVSYEEICEYGNDGVGFLCGAKALKPELLKGTTLTVELRLYEATDGSMNSETRKHITVGTYTYKF